MPIDATEVFIENPDTCAVNQENSNPKEDGEVRRRALSIFRYLRDLALLKTAIVRDLNSYERVFWLDSVRGKKKCSAQCFRPDGVTCEGELVEDDIWMRVRKLDEPAAPAVPPALQEWIAPDSGANLDVPPRLLDQITDAPGRSDATLQYKFLKDHPELTGALAQYLEETWKPWAEKHKDWRDFQENVYSPLFSIHRDLKRLGEEFELVLGLGCISWITATTQRVRRHLVTAQVTLEFDPAGGEFTLRPSSDGAKLAIELDMLEAAEQPTIVQIDVIKSDLSGAEDDPWNFDVVDRALRGFARAINEQGIYHPDGYLPKQPERTPQVAFAPALLLRRRNSRGLLTAFKSIIEQLETGIHIPAGVRRLTSAGVEQTQDESREFRPDISQATSPKRIYFPRPANEDQQQIVEQLENRHGVLVQGPPGTGKSHTIANLICHLLATQKRVLITAQTPRALKVLRDKLPEEIKPLCLSLLGNDKTAQDRVEESVRRITDKADSWNAGGTDIEIRNADTKLDQLYRQETKLEREIRIFREMEIHEHSIAEGNYRGTAQAIANSVRRERSQFEWFHDTVAPDRPLAIFREDLSIYKEGCLRFPDSHIAELKMRRPKEGSEIMPDEKLLALVRHHRALQEQLHSSTVDTSGLSRCSLGDVKAAHFALQQFQDAVRQLPLSSNHWAISALDDLLRGASTKWNLLVFDTASAIDSVNSSMTRLEDVAVRMPANRDPDVLLADLSDLLDHLQNGRKMGFWIFRPRLVRRTIYICREAKVNGRACDTVVALSMLKEHIQRTITLKNIWREWEGKASPTTDPLRLQIAELGELLSILQRILEIDPFAKAASTALSRLQSATIPNLHELPEVDRFIVLCEHKIVQEEFKQADAQITTQAQVLRAIAGNPNSHPICAPDYSKWFPGSTGVGGFTNSHPVCARLAESIEMRNEQGLLSALDELHTLGCATDNWANWANLDKQLRGELPILIQSILQSPEDSVWIQRIEKWPAPYHWAQADAWCKKYTSQSQAEATEAELKRVKGQIAHLLEHAAAMRAWSSCLTAMSPAHEQHLNAWRQAIKKMGKGTGKYASHWRRVAQTELEQCRDAIPAWVMPLYRVFETVTPKPGIFDVAIIDEASQCGPESLILFYLAKKVIVVGDDKQISPSNVGLDKDQAKILLRQHLDGIDLANTFDVDSSLFDHGQIRLGKRITLREHFRCMPEIIRFSNDLCYNGSLIPLRQYPPKRLAPFVARFVADGKREGGPQSAKNQREAQAIVETIGACCHDPFYEGKTMGVISLLGEHQAKLIERLLLERIGAEEIDRRQIVCGDAYSFQGDERNVIFLSMVISMRGDGDKGFSALTKSSDQQRFNVAASRAQDQLWLFHSVKLEDVGNHECMRHKLLTYCYDPARHIAQSAGIDIASLREANDSTNRPKDPPEPFDSWFEVDVYLRLLGRGYRVLPQYKAGRHRIDLVVEGKTRLAVECDGDIWHGPERFDEDMARQRQLERAGWRFWRMPGSTFYHNPEVALEPLWALLKELGIGPMPATDGSGSSDGYIPCVAMPADNGIGIDRTGGKYRE